MVRGPQSRPPVCVIVDKDEVGQFLGPGVWTHDCHLEGWYRPYRCSCDRCIHVACFGRRVCVEQSPLRGMWPLSAQGLLEMRASGSLWLQDLFLLLHLS